MLNLDSGWGEAILFKVQLSELLGILIPITLSYLKGLVLKSSYEVSEAYSSSLIYFSLYVLYANILFSISIFDILNLFSKYEIFINNIYKFFVKILWNNYVYIY